MEENALEKSLRLAATEPANRPEFYRLLLDSTVFVIGSAGPDVEDTATLPAGSTVQITNWQGADGSVVIPFFSSLQALERAKQRDASYLALSARALFEMTRGATLVLNPRSDYGREFFPHEVEMLLSEGVTKKPTQRIVKKGAEVLIGQPRDYPDAMVASLTVLLAKHSNVKAAYLALMHDRSRDEKPHLVIGIEVEGNVEPAIREAGIVASDLAPGGEPVDLVRVVPGERGLSDYFLHEVKPFYERRWGTKLKSLFGIGRA